MNRRQHRVLTGALTCLLLSLPSNSPADIYRWHDAAGTTHYGDHPPASAQQLKQLQPTAYDSYGKVVRVIDGDTVELNDGRHVRLLGINAPEIAHHGRTGEPLADDAKRFLRKQVNGKQVRLRYDQQHRDHYHRLLARLYLEDGTDAGALLLQRGLAHALFKWPNLQGAEHYYALERVARGQRRGIWKLSAYQIKSLADLSAQRYRFTRLAGRVTDVIAQRNYDYLRFGNALRVAIKQARLPLFAAAGIDITALVGHHLVLRGWLSQRHGEPYLELEQPFQLEQVN